MTARLLTGDVREMLRTLDAESVQCVVTSPPYFALRDYGVVGQIGLEPTVAEYVQTMVAVFRDVRRVMRPDATLWLNLGDSYSGSGKGRNADGSLQEGGKQGTSRGTVEGALWKSDVGKPKDLIGIPWRVALALQDDGWWLRSDIIWAKPNPMPESVTDRPTRSHEYVFLLTKAARYYYDADAIREPLSEKSWFVDEVRPTKAYQPDGLVVNTNGTGTSTLRTRASLNPAGRNKRTVWTIPTSPYSEAHFATFPLALVEPCILAGSRIGDTVLDPFSGSGTVGVVALRHGRQYIGIDLNEEYTEMARRRITGDAPLLNVVEVLPLAV